MTGTTSRYPRCLRAMLSARPAGPRTSRPFSSSLWPLDLDLQRFPPVLCTIGYGSGVFRQAGYSKTKRPMVDVVLVIVGGTDVCKQWHRDNLAMNPGHYSGLLRMLGPGAMASVQSWGPGLFYNPMVRLATKDGSDVEAKYGVMGVDVLLRDLTSWDSLYMAGRLQKPCLVEYCDVMDSGLRTSLQDAITANRRAALCAALLLTRQEEQATITAWDALCGVVGLSYGGDVRVGLAENPDKIANIVRAQQQDLLDMYTPLAEELDIGIEHHSDHHAFRLDIVAADVLLGSLPAAVRARMAERARCEKSATSEQHRNVEELRQALHDIVRRSSSIQSSKGVLTAGLSRGALYLLQKVRKRFS